MIENIINTKNMTLLRNLFDAVEFAAYKHRYQKRKGLRPLPYINHPISVTKFLLDHLTDAGLEMLQAAILHDTLEDTKTTFDELQNRFGDKVASIVNELTDDKSLSYNTRKKLQVENARNLSFEAGCIKIADKYCNIYDVLNTRIGWSQHHKVQYVKWAMQVVEQIQSRNPELEKSFYEIIEVACETLKIDFSQGN